MIFVFLFSTLGVVAWALVATVHDTNGRIAKLCSTYNGVAQISLLVLGATDWAYSVVEVSPYELLALGHLEVLAIFAPALALCFLIPMRPKKRTAEALLIHSFQAIAFIPALLSLEHKTGISFLSWNTCVALTLSSSSVLLSLSPMLTYGATFGGRFHEIAYKDRATLISYINDARQSLAELQWKPPRTFLDAGDLFGKVVNREVSLKTRFSFWPFGYQLDFQINLTTNQQAWMLGPSSSNSLTPEARKWAQAALPESEENSGKLHTPSDSALSKSQLCCLSDIRAQFQDRLHSGYLICTGKALSYRYIDPRGLDFGAQDVQKLIGAAQTIEEIQPCEAIGIS